MAKSPPGMTETSRLPGAAVSFRPWACLPSGPVSAHSAGDPAARQAALSASVAGAAPSHRVTKVTSPPGRSGCHVSISLLPCTW
jgi:hypothetical protein